MGQYDEIYLSPVAFVIVFEVESRKMDAVGVEDYPIFVNISDDTKRQSG